MADFPRAAGHPDDRGAAVATGFDCHKQLTPVGAQAVPRFLKIDLVAAPWVDPAESWGAAPRA